jgi:transketolase
LSKLNPIVVPEEAVKCVQMLSADMVEKANSGHPGTPMGAAEMALTLWANHLRFDPQDPHWPGRDRFILSAGHASALLYSLLHCFGFDLSLDDLQRFRQLSSKTPGHPEVGYTDGVEVTTGPLGQGVANAVGFALGQAMLSVRVASPEFDPASGRVYALVGDGCMMEGISYEAASLAGHLSLGNLCLIYDSNRITIEGGTDLAFTEDVAARFAAAGWKVEKLSAYDQPALNRAFNAFAAGPLQGQPTLLIASSIIGKGAPDKQGTSKAHGEALGAQEMARTRQALGWQHPPFTVPEGARAWFQERQAAQRSGAQAWQASFASWRQAHPEKARLWDQHFSQADPQGLAQALLAAAKGDAATRQHSSQAINAAAKLMPWLIGGSADLGGSNNSDIKGGGDVGLAGPSGMAESWKGRVLHFGVREHAMGGILNGLNLHGAWRAFGATFLQFADYMRPSIRLAALMHAPSIYVFTHDSVFLGEDGPTHQPVEHVECLRLIPNLHVFRPADGMETAMAWAYALDHEHGPTALCLTRQKVPSLKLPQGFDPQLVWRGGYVALEAAAAGCTLVATGSEVSAALAAAQLLLAQGIKARVVSMPNRELFEAQDAAYRGQVLGAAPLASVEAGVTSGWRALTGSQGLNIGIDTWGVSAPAPVLAEYFGLSPEKIASRVAGWLKELKG